MIEIHGAGAAGLTLATELLSRGAEVRLFDPHRQPGHHACSWYAGGMLAPFCEGESAEAPVVVEGQKAARWWESQGVQVEKKGSLVVALERDKQELERFSRRTQGFEWLDQAGIAALEPDLAERFTTALYFPDEAHINPRDALAHLTAQLPSEVWLSKPGAADVDCTGLNAKPALNDLRGVRGEMAVLQSHDFSLSRPIRLLHPRYPLYMVPRADGKLMLGATQIENESREAPHLRSLLELFSVVYAVHPALAEAQVLEIGADARPAFPDHLPRLVKTSDRLYLNGLFRHGFLLSPSLAQQAADYLLDGRTSDWFYEH